MREYRSCIEQVVLVCCYIVLQLVSVQVAFSNHSSSNLETTGRLFAVGLTGFALFILSTRIDIGERTLRGLTVLAGGVYGIVGYYGLISTDILAIVAALGIVCCVLILEGVNKTGTVYLIINSMIITGWILSLVITELYNVLLAGAFGLGLVTFVLATTASGKIRTNFLAANRTASIGLAVVMLLMTTLVYVHSPGQWPIVAGALGTVLFADSLGTVSVRNQSVPSSAPQTR